MEQEKPEYSDGGVVNWTELYDSYNQGGHEQKAHINGHETRKQRWDVNAHSEAGERTRPTGQEKNYSNEQLLEATKLLTTGAKDQPTAQQRGKVTQT